jgi:chromosomal replication initiation ATPase DnaA
MLVLRARGLSLPAIGRLLHRDHSTVFSGLERAEKLRAAGGDFARLCEVIEQ